MKPENNKPTAPIKMGIDPKATHQTKEFKHDVALTTLRVDPQGRFVAAGAEDLDVQLWNLETGDKQTLKGHKSWVRSIDFTQDGKRMLSACWGGVIQIWDLKLPKVKLLRTVEAHQGAARFVRVNQEGTQFATCGNDLLVKVWNLEDGELLHEFAGHERHVYGVDFHPQGSHVVSQDLMGNIHVWSLNTSKLERKIDASVMTGYDNKFQADMGGARDMEFRPDGSQWASAGITKVVNSFAGVQDPIIVLIDWKTGEIQKKIKSSDKNVQGIAWGVRYHPQGFLIGAIANRNGKGELWFAQPDAETPFHVTKLPSVARGLDLLPDNKRLAVASADGRVRLYKMTQKPATAEKGKPKKK